jgi:hypothetical protein
MASVTLRELWIHRWPEADQHVQVDVFGSFIDEEDHLVDVRMYAGGAERAVKRVGSSRTLDVGYETDGATARRIASWASHNVMLRDASLPEGRVVWGVYRSAPITEIDGGLWVAQSFVLHRVSISPEV